jgi:hypothetical protein
MTQLSSGALPAGHEAPEPLGSIADTSARFYRLMQVLEQCSFP